MSLLMRWETKDGPVVMEVDDSSPGYKSVSRKPGEAVHAVGESFENALSGVRSAAQSALDAFRDEVLDPDNVEIEFGVKLTAEAGAVIAKTSVEGNLTVRLSWSRTRTGVEGVGSE